MQAAVGDVYVGDGEGVIPPRPPRLRFSNLENIGFYFKFCTCRKSHGKTMVLFLFTMHIWLQFGHFFL